MSAQNIFNAGVNALAQQPSLKKVLITKHIPRYDPKDVDPLGLKPSLSHLFDSTLSELWMKSPLKEKIFIGTHNLDCTGARQSARYRSTKTGKFDGIHLYGSSGSKFYTLSMLNILRSAGLTSSEHDFHLSCAQFQYQTKETPGKLILGVVDKQPPIKDDDCASTMDQLDGNVSVSSDDTSVFDDDDQFNAPKHIPVHTGHRPVSNHSNNCRLPPVRKTIRRDNKVLQAVTLPRISSYNMRSLMPKLNSFSSDMLDRNTDLSFFNRNMAAVRK